MSFAGHTLDMIKRINANNALKNRHREKRTNKAFFRRKSEKLFFEPLLSEVEISELKASIRANKKKERQKERLIYIMVVLFFLSILIFFFLRS